VDEFDFEKLSREIVASRLSDLKDAPHAAAEVARKIITTGVQSTKVRQDPHITVAAVCRGVMGGMLILNKPLPPAAVSILKEMAAISHDVHLDPGDLMTWGMEGIAAVAHMAGHEAQQSVHMAIEETFMGAGVVFDQICSRVAAP